MKKIAVFALAGMFSLSLFSCKKCVECTYEYAGTKYTSGEVCGSKKDIDNVKSTWEAAGTNAGVTTTCVDK